MYRGNMKNHQTQSNKKTYIALPKSPFKRRAVLKTHLKNTWLCTKDSVSKSLVKKSVNDVVASVSGEVIENARNKKNLAKCLGLPDRIISDGTRIPTELAICKEKDAFHDNVENIAHVFWLRPGMSRPSGNMKDIKRKIIGCKNVVSYMIHLLEITQYEIYEDLKNEYPDIKMFLRRFEKCKPYFVNVFDLTIARPKSYTSSIAAIDKYMYTIKLKVQLFVRKTHTAIVHVKQENTHQGQLRKKNVPVKGGKSIMKHMLVNNAPSPGEMFGNIKA
ncbi:hypothetical protein MAR_021702 [Mya arenaria]|uniref:Uncharacterized protein n=1 Tax=Mya arenaria TaxID=6604 RepID=A0ABY7E8E3_MYAAR|nr:hypothetical protein MAR_021702 [Mya arenaria]